jgi:hypothetical protein
LVPSVLGLGIGTIVEDLFVVSVIGILRVNALEVQLA